MKGISFIELHIEKIVVGVAALVLLGAVAVELMSGRSVTAGKETLTPSNVSEILDSKARAVESRLNDGRVHVELDRQQLPQVAMEFTEGLRRGVGQGPDLPRIAPSLAGALLDSDTLADTHYRMPVIPAPVINPTVTQTSDAILAETFAQPEFPGLAALFPDRGAAPALDITFTTPSAWLDVRRTLEELRRSDPGKNPPEAAPPSSWYQEACYVVDVVFEREELLPSGEWGNRQRVAPLPDRLSFRNRIPRADLDLRNEVLAKLARPPLQFEILQPDFYPTKNEAIFTEERLAAAGTATPGESREIARLRQRISDRQRQLALREEELRAAGGPLDEEPQQRGGDGARGGSGSGGSGEGGRRGGGAGGGGGLGGGSGGGLGGGGPMGGGGAMGGAGGPSGDPAKDALRRRLTRLVKQLKEEIASLTAQLEEKVPSARRSGDQEDSATKTLPDLATLDRVMVWAHDVAVRPQATYRYRAFVEVYNPFFGRKSQLVPQQASYAASLVLRSEPSAWSQPVQVTPSSTFFVTNATTEGGALGLGTADIEVFRLVEGVRRRHQFTVQPGDRIGRVVEPRRNETGPSIDFTTDWFVVAILEDLTLDRAETERARACMVVVRRVDGGDEIVLRSPPADAESPDRRRLIEESQAAPTAGVGGGGSGA